MEGKINIHNYEAFLLDYMEGHLSSEDSLLLEAFALAHPELDINLEESGLVYIETESASFDAKDSIKKIPADLVPDELLIGYIENTLNGEEKQLVETSCAANPNLAKELKLYQSTILETDTSIVFENKNRLKKQGQVIPFSPAVFRAAAAIILLAGLIILFRSLQGNKTNGEKLAALESNTRQNSSTVRTNTTVLPVQENNSAVIESSNQLASKTNHKTTVKHSSPVQNAPLKETPSLAANDNQPVNNDKTNNILPVKKNELSPNPDSLSKTALAFNQQKNNSSYIVTLERDDEETSDPKKEKGFWAAAKRTLSNLNKMGVKKVNGTETVNSEVNSETYVLSLGNFSIQKNKYNQE